MGYFLFSPYSGLTPGLFPMFTNLYVAFLTPQRVLVQEHTRCRRQRVAVLHLRPGDVACKMVCERGCSLEEFHLLLGWTYALGPQAFVAQVPKLSQAVV